MKRLDQIILMASTVLASWLGMQALHEIGHVLGAWFTGGEVKQVVLNPLTISRTDLAQNPHPLLVVWAGPICGVLFPLVLWGGAMMLRMRSAFVFRFVAGFCLIANGAYIAIGSFDRVGDCGEMLRHGSLIWQLWLFGAITIPLGFSLWHRQGIWFGFGSSQGNVDHRVAWSTFVVLVLQITLAALVGGS